MYNSVGRPLYKSRAWKRVREAVLLRDHFLCVECGEPAEEVHHKIHLTASNVTDDKIALNPDNLVSLCHKCHMSEHANDVSMKKDTGITNDYEFDENGMLVRRTLL